MHCLYLSKKIKTLALLSLILLATALPVFAGQNYNFGASLVSVPSAMSGIGGALEYVSTPTFKGAEPPLTMAYGARVDFATCGFDLSGVIFSIITGGGATVKANEHLSVTLYTGPSFLLYMGEGKNGSLDADTGLGAGLAANIAYAFDNPGFVLRLGAWASASFLLTDTTPFACGAEVSIGGVYGRL